MKNKVLLIISMFAFAFMNSQTTQTLDAKHALQQSEFIKAVPQESNGYLVMHKDSRIDYWVIKAMEDGEVQRVFQTNRGENHIQMDQEVYSNWGYSYLIQGMSPTGEIIFDIDVIPEIDNPTWIYNGCNRPTCVKTSGSSNYAYGMDVYEHITNDAYKLTLNKAWSHLDTGMRIPYYIEVSDYNLTAALANQNLTYATGIQSPQTYFWDNGMFKVALGMGVWHPDQNTTTNQINGVGGEGCTLSFGTAMNRMNASAQLSSTLTCSGQQYSQNQGGGGSNPYGVGSYASASSSILDCSALSSSTTWTISYTWEQVTDPNGIVSNILVLNLVSTNIGLDCDTTTTNPNNPCPPGYYYAPGGGDPCKPIDPIVEKLERISIIPVDVEIEGEGDGDTLEAGLYLMVLNYGEGMSIPIYQKIENKVFLEGDRANNTDRLTIFPNPVKDQFTVSLDHEEAMISYSVFDRLGNEVKKGTFSSNSNQQILDLDELRQGIYFLNIETEGNSYSKTIIKE